MFALVQSRWHLSIGNSLAAQVFSSYCYKPVVYTLGFYKFVLNAHLTLNRIVALRPSLKSRLSFSPARSTTYTFLATVVLMFPHYLVHTPVKYIILNSDAVLEDFYVTKTASFVKTKTGAAVLNSIAAFRSISMCLIDLVLNGMVVYYFKKVVVTNTHQLLVLLRRGDNSERSNSVQTEKSITIIVIIHCSISLAHQLLLLGRFFYTVSAKEATENLAILTFLANFVSVIRQAINFVLFYLFNAEFRKDVRALFSRLFTRPVHI
jgi:hypothetical protein